MITFIRTIDVIPGKSQEAVAWAQKTAELVKKKLGITLTVHRCLGSRPFSIAIIGHADSLAQLEGYFAQLAKDSEHPTHVQAVEGIFRDWDDRFWQQI